jgi:nicotinamidase-related amidase
MKHLQDLNGTGLLVVDVQDNHFPRCVAQESTLSVMVRVVQAAKLLGLPIVVTEQYPKVFGATVPALAEVTAPEQPLPKMHFSCLADPAIAERLKSLGLSNLVLVGTETHICVCQTALMALEQGLSVAVVADGVTGRKQQEHDLALQRMAAHGVDVLPWESLVYEWMCQAGTAVFKQILPLVKQ